MHGTSKNINTFETYHQPPHPAFLPELLELEPQPSTVVRPRRPPMASWDHSPVSLCSFSVYEFVTWTAVCVNLCHEIWDSFLYLPISIHVMHGFICILLYAIRWNKIRHPRHIGMHCLLQYFVKSAWIRKGQGIGQQLSLVRRDTYKNLGREFGTRTGKNYTKTQFKNKWDSTKAL